MSADPESAVLTILDGSSYTLNTNLFRGPVIASGQIGGAYPIPQKAVFVRFAGGTPPLVHRSCSVEEKEYMIDVVVRGEPDKYGTTRTDAQTLSDLVNDNTPSGYIDAKVQTSHPQWVDRDDAGSHYFVFTVRLRKLEA